MIAIHGTTAGSRRLARVAGATLLALAPCVAAAIWGPKLCGRALMSIGFARPGAAMAGEGAWISYELALQGRWAEAVAAFGPAPGTAYDRGTALVPSGRYEDAVEAFDAALAFDPEDEDARHERP